MQFKSTETIKSFVFLKIGPGNQAIQTPDVVQCVALCFSTLANRWGVRTELLLPKFYHHFKYNCVYFITPVHKNLSLVGANLEAQLNVKACYCGISILERWAAAVPPLGTIG